MFIAGVWRTKADPYVRTMLRLALVVASLFGASATITDCDPTSVFRPSSLSITPDPPVPGAPSTIAIRFTNLGPAISDGQENGAVNYNGLPYSYSQALCTGVACPIESGDQERNNTSDWPDMTGKMTVQVNWVGPSKESLLCYKVVAKIATPGLRGRQRVPTSAVALVPLPAVSDTNVNLLGIYHPSIVIPEWFNWTAAQCPMGP